MLSLIAREIRDQVVYLVGLCLTAITMLALLILQIYVQMEMVYLPILGMGVALLLIGFCALGMGQMYGDRVNRIAPLLATLAVTRTRILAARVAVGVLAVLATLVPIAIAVTLVLGAFLPPLEFYWRMIVGISITSLLVGMACYCVGLLIGWTTNKTALLLVDGLLLVALLVSVVWIKGFGLDTAGLLLLFIGATLLRTWQTFTSASL